MWRRLKEDRNQHYGMLNCPCWTDPKAMAQFKEQPAFCSWSCCGNPRRWGKGEERLTMQERRELPQNSGHSSRRTDPARL